MRFVQHLFKRLFDLRRRSRAAFDMPERLSDCYNRRRELLKRTDHFGTPIELIDSAHGDEPSAPAVNGRYAQPIAADQPAPIVDDRIGHAVEFEASVNLRRESLKLSPKRSAIAEFAQLAIAAVFRRQVANRHK